MPVVIENMKKCENNVNTEAAGKCKQLLSPNETFIDILYPV